MKFQGTISRKKINISVAKHLQQALTWVSEDAYDIKKFQPIRDASTHDELVAAVKKVSLKLLGN